MYCPRTLHGAKRSLSGSVTPGHQHNFHPPKRHGRPTFTIETATLDVAAVKGFSPIEEEDSLENVKKYFGNCQFVLLDHGPYSQIDSTLQVQ